MSDSSEPKPEIKPPAEIKRETLNTETKQEYTVFSYCVLAKDVKMPTGLMVGMLKENPHFIVISNCPRDPTDDPNIDTKGYKIKHNGGFYIFVRICNDIEIIGCGPRPGDERTNIMEETKEESKGKEKQCNKDVSYFYVDVEFKSRSGGNQIHRLLAVYHPKDIIPKEKCKKLVCAKLDSALRGKENPRTIHICGALNWDKGSITGAAWQNYNVSKIFEDYEHEFKYFVDSERDAPISQIFVSEKEYSRSSWGTLFTNTPDTIEMRVKPRHPNFFLPEDLKIKDEVTLGQGGAAQRTPRDTPKGQKSKEVAAVVVFHIKPFVKKSATSAQTAGKPSTSVEVKTEVDTGVDEVTGMAGKMGLYEK